MSWTNLREVTEEFWMKYKNKTKLFAYRNAMQTYELPSNSWKFRQTIHWKTIHWKTFMLRIKYVIFNIISHYSGMLQNFLKLYRKFCIYYVISCSCNVINSAYFQQGEDNANLTFLFYLLSLHWRFQTE